MFVKHVKPGRKKPGDVPPGRPPPIVAPDGNYIPNGTKKS